MTQPQDQIFFKISDLSEKIGVETHVLRFWEKEFPQIKPLKMAGRKRLYRLRDLEIFEEIKRLLYDERFTIEGARKRLDKGLIKQETLFTEPVEPAGADKAPTAKIIKLTSGQDELAAQARLDQVRRELLDLRAFITGGQPITPAAAKKTSKKSKK